MKEALALFLKQLAAGFGGFGSRTSPSPLAWTVYVSESADTAKEPTGEHLDMYMIHLIDGKEASVLRRTYEACRVSGDGIERHPHEVLRVGGTSNCSVPEWIAIPGGEDGIGILLEYVGEARYRVAPSSSPAVHHVARGGRPAHSLLPSVGRVEGLKLVVQDRDFQ